MRSFLGHAHVLRMREVFYGFNPNLLGGADYESQNYIGLH